MSLPFDLSVNVSALPKSGCRCGGTCHHRSARLGRHVWPRIDIKGAVFVSRQGRGPVHAGSASHSAHRIRRSSSPTLTKTKAASSLPVFDPANMAGTPYAFLMVALLAMQTPDGCCCAVRTEADYHFKITTAAISRRKNTASSTGGSSDSRKSNFAGFDT
jgi:hypothetical protein